MQNSVTVNKNKYCLFDNNSTITNCCHHSHTTIVMLQFRNDDFCCFFG